MSFLTENKVFDFKLMRYRPATCADCGLSKAYTLYDQYELCQHLEHKVRCLLHNCAKDPDDMACLDFEKVNQWQ